MRATAEAADIPASGASGGRAKVRRVGMLPLGVASWVSICGWRRVMTENIGIEYLAFKEEGGSANNRCENADKQEREHGWDPGRERDSAKLWTSRSA